MTITHIQLYELLETIHGNQIETIIPLLRKLTSEGTTIMATLDDLNKAVADIQAAETAIQAADMAVQSAVQNAITLIQSLHTGGGTVSDAQVEAAVAALETAAGNSNKAATDFSTAAANLGGAKAQP